MLGPEELGREGRGSRGRARGAKHRRGQQRFDVAGQGR